MTPDRRPYIAANWKMWGTRAEARSYIERFVGLVPPEQDRPAEIVVCVPFTALEICVEGLRGTGIRVAAQNMHQEESGAYTGEISAPMLTEIGIDAVVLGHSERRQYYNETDRALQEKVPAALDGGLQPMLCVGESEDEHEAGDTQRKLRHQVQEALEKVPDARLHEGV